ncbi:MAG: TIR domain-containing protein, partial [Clostridia bacterium]|nr:TIR domain-containing protein [Clostridia bacterium]
MAHKTFITYKYSDIVEGHENNNLRDRIINKLGEAAQYYKGENGYSDNLSSYSAQYIKSYLKDKIYDTSVMIVIVSPNMKQSAWMEWEIKYALREQTRNNRTSHADGVICVVQKSELYEKIGLDPYSWAKLYGGD